jgi:RimJ/RimL family protein N-acetyltransferase
MVNAPRFKEQRAELVTTERLFLEPLKVAHAREMVPVLDDPELHKYVGGKPLSLDELRERYQHQVRGRSRDGAQRWFNWIIRERATGAAVGFVQATVEMASGTADVAWVVGSTFQRRRFAREAASAMVSWLRGQDVAAITAHIHPDNASSEGVARALGLAPTSTVRSGEVRWESRSQT